MLQPLMRRTWAPKGKTPVLHAWDRHDRMTAITALTLSPHRRKLDLYFQLLDHNAKAEDVFWFLISLRRELGRPLIIVWDRLSAHRKAARWLQELGCHSLSFEYLPPYCPDLNPVEHVWTTTKWGSLANWPAPSIEAVHERVEENLQLQAAKRSVLKGHFRWAGLDLR